MARGDYIITEVEVITGLMWPSLIAPCGADLGVVELLAPGEAEPEQVEGVGAEALALLGVRHPDVARLPGGLLLRKCRVRGGGGWG